LEKARLEGRRETIRVSSILLLSLLESSLFFGKIFPDSPGYIEVAYFFNGKGTSFSQSRMLRPLIPFLASILNKLVDISTAFGIVNLLLWLASSYVMFQLSKDLLDDSDLAWYVSISFTASLPVIIYGSGVLTDMAGFFFVILSAWLTRRLQKERSALRYLSIGTVMGLGILGREVVFACLPFFILSEISQRRDGMDYRKTLLTVLIALLPSVLWSTALGLNYLEWFKTGGIQYAGGWTFNPKELLKSVLLAFSFLVPFAPIGFLEEEDESKCLFYLFSLLSIVSILIVWPVKDYRFSFLLSPCVIPLSVKGIDWAATRLSGKPIFSAVEPSLWKKLILIVYVAFSNYQAYTVLLRVFAR